MVHLSNVLGGVLPADRVCQLAHEVGWVRGAALLPSMATHLWRRLARPAQLWRCKQAALRTFKPCRAS